MVTKLTFKLTVIGTSWLYSLFGMMCKINQKEWTRKNMKKKFTLNEFKPKHYKPN